MPDYQISQLQQLGLVSALDVQFAQLLLRLGEQGDDAFLLAAALTSRWVRNGHICLDLAELAGQPLPLEDAPTGKCPDLASWLESLQTHPAVEVQQNSLFANLVQQPRPLVLAGTRLYLQRYWRYEQDLAQQLLKRAAQNSNEPETDISAVAKSIAALFAAGQANPQQQQAVQTALQYPFCVISGGPGTGKTSTVIKILALLLEQQPRLRIQLLAPTGKAAARLQQSISQARQQLPCSEAVKALIPEQASTIHRYLGVIPHSTEFRFNAQRPLPIDCLILDEASMVDLALLSKLLAALPEHARLILLGDKDQLASVEAGAVLGDVWRSLEMQAEHPLRKNLVLLETSHRFRDDSGIGQLAKSIKQADSGALLAQLGEHQAALNNGLQWLSSSQAEDYRGLVLRACRHYLSQPEPAQALQAFNQFRVLCAHRHGPYGVSGLNRQIETWLQDARVLRRAGRWYPGRPVMINENDYNLELFNGDIGLIWPDENGQLRAYFSSDDAQLRSFLPSRLPGHDTAYAMTVHKSQGSEFNEVLLVLPDELSPVLSRELLYTGITRARENLYISAKAEILQQCVQQQIQRASGLAEALCNSKTTTPSWASGLF